MSIHAFAFAATAVASLALAGHALAAPSTLASCRSGGEGHAVVLQSEGRVAIDGAHSALVSATRSEDANGATVYELLTTGGNEVRLTRSSGAASPALASFWDRNVIGGKCGAGSTLDTKALDALVATSASLRRNTWRLADCKADGSDTGRFTLDYTLGFAPGTLLVRSNTGPNAESVAYVISRFDQEGAAGTGYTTLGGEGAYSYSALGRHSRPLGDLIVKRYNLTGTYGIETGEALLDDALGECNITNLWHVAKILAK